MFVHVNPEIFYLLTYLLTFLFVCVRVCVLEGDCCCDGKATTQRSTETFISSQPSHVHLGQS